MLCKVVYELYQREPEVLVLSFEVPSRKCIVTLLTEDCLVSDPCLRQQRHLLRYQRCRCGLELFKSAYLFFFRRESVFQLLQLALMLVCEVFVVLTLRLSDFEAAEEF